MQNACRHLTRNLKSSAILIVAGVMLGAVGCAEIEQVLEYEGRLEMITTVKYGRESSGTSLTGVYTAREYCTDGIFFTPAYEFDYGLDLVSLEGKKIRTYGGRGGFGYSLREVSAVTVSNDESLVAVAGIIENFSSRGVIIYNVATGERDGGPIGPPSGVDGSIGAIAFRESGDTIAVAYGNDIAVYDIRNSVIRPPKLLKGVGFLHVTSIAFSPLDSDHLLTSEGLWSLSEEKMIIVFDETYLAAGYTADGRNIVAVGWNGFSLLDGVSGEEIGNVRDIEETYFGDEFEEQPNVILTLEMTSDGAYAITGAEEGIISVWDVATGAIIARDTTVSGVILGTVLEEPARFLTMGRGSAIIWQINP